MNMMTQTRIVFTRRVGVVRASRLSRDGKARAALVERRLKKAFRGNATPRARGRGGGRGGGVGTYQFRNVIASRGGERLRDLRGAERKARWVSDPRGLAGKNERARFVVERRGDMGRGSRPRTATSSPPNALSLCSAPFLRRSRSRRSLRSARRDSLASIGRRPSLCVGREINARFRQSPELASALGSLDPRISRAFLELGIFFGF